MSTILITGMHRSGTSMVAHALNAAGLHLGPADELIAPAADNPEGFFEHESFVRLSDELLAACGGAWDHLPPAPPMAADDPRVARLVEDALGVIAEVARPGIWGWKDPRTALTIRFWQDLVPDLKVVVCLRHPLEVAASLKRRNNTSFLHGLSLWEGYYSSLLSAVGPEHRIVTHYQRHLVSPSAEMQRLVTFAGLPLDGIDAAAAVVHASSRHHDLNVAPVEAGLPVRVGELYEALCAEADEAMGATRPRPAGEVRRETVELLRVTDELAHRGRKIEALRRERDELARRVAELEDMGRGEVLSGLIERLNRLEDAAHEPRYWVEGLAERDDADMVRGCRELVRGLPQRNRPILVLARGDAMLLDLYGRPAWNFPADDDSAEAGPMLSDGASVIAHLETMRAAGAAYLLVPHNAREWLALYPTFVDHLVDHYAVVGEQAGVGVVFDIGERRRTDTGWPRSLRAVLDRVTTLANEQDLSVLDWTLDNHAAHLPGRNVFAPSVSGPVLPYRENSIDVVLLERSAADDSEVAAEAARVARLAVLTVTSGDRAEVTAVHALTSDVTHFTRPVVKVIASSGDSNPAWRAHVLDSLADDCAVSFATIPTDTVGADLVLVVEEGVVPMPGGIESIRRTLADPGVGAVATKLLSGDGSIVSAGAVVFSDGSVAGVADGSFDVTTPWHEFLRDACGGQGALWLDPSVLATFDRDLLEDPDPDPMVWSAAVWSTGLKVRYQPSAVSVVTAPRPASPVRADQIAEAFSPVLASRPDRPDELDNRTWRALVATDDVEGGWR